MDFMIVSKVVVAFESIQAVQINQELDALARM